MRRTVQFEHRVSQRIGDTGTCQRRSDPPNKHMFGSASRDDKAADAHVITGLNSHTGREVDGLRPASDSVSVLVFRSQCQSAWLSPSQCHLGGCQSVGVGVGLGGAPGWLDQID